MRNRMIGQRSRTRDTQHKANDDPSFSLHLIVFMPRRVAANLDQADPPMALSSPPSASVSSARMFNGTAASRWYERLGSGAYPQHISDPSIRSATSGAGSRRESRYLREQDRCSIIRRMATGETQANLAREFGVTRAAICHIKKNRVRILEKAVDRHPKRTRYQTISKPLITRLDSPDDSVVYEVRSLPMMILLTALRSKETRPRAFRHFADRAIRLLLEEALACEDSRAFEPVPPSESVQATQTSCGVALGEDALPMLASFRAIHPESPAGYLSLRSRGSETSTNDGVQLPPNIERKTAFLMMPVCPTGSEVCAAVQRLLDHGMQESSIFFVCLVTSEIATSAICRLYPAVRIVTAAIDPDVNEAAISPGIGDFRSRYSIQDSGTTPL